MALGVIWDGIWDEAIWNNDIWEQASVTPPSPVTTVGNQRRHLLGLATFDRR